MPRRTQLATVKAEETRERILGSALDLFRTRGFDATTMRDVAAAAGVATGAAYYYFHSKEDLVMAFYEQTALEMREILPAELAATRDLKKRIRRIIHLKFEQFTAHRAFLGALFRSAVDPSSPLSPFGSEAHAIREESIDWFRQAVDGAGESVPKDLKAILPPLLWLYQMGVLLFWIYDRSPEQEKTRLLVDGTLDLIVKLIRIARVPLLAPMRRSVIKTLQTIGVGAAE